MLDCPAYLSLSCQARAVLLESLGARRHQHRQARLSVRRVTGLGATNSFPGVQRANVMIQLQRMPRAGGKQKDRPKAVSLMLRILYQAKRP